MTKGKNKPQTRKPIASLAAKYNHFIKNKTPTRIHMSLILLSVSLTGMHTSRILLELGFSVLWIRYLITSILCYLFFLLYIKIWLLYINPGKNERKDGSVGNLDLSGIDINIESGESVKISEMLGQGGNFGGGGASASFDGGSSSSILPDIGGVDLDIDGDAAAPILIVVVVGIAVIVIFGGAVFIVYQAPAILSEAAFEGLLATGFFKSTRDISSGNWVGSILKRTWIPFLLISTVATGSGWLIGYLCPIATKIFDISKCL